VSNLRRMRACAWPTTCLPIDARGIFFGSLASL
jgi:hypothetical protein